MQLAVDLLIIFTLRLLDVGLSTVRIVLLGRGSRWRAAALGFGESFIWVLAASRVLGGLDDPVRMVAFAGGFAAGTFVGATVERWLAIGQAMVRIIAPVDSPEVAKVLRDDGFGATVVNGDGRAGEVRVTFSVVPRRQVKRVLRLIHDANRDAFVTVESINTVDMHARRAPAVRK